MLREVILVGLFLLMGSDARQQNVDIDWTEEDGGENTDVAGDVFDRNETNYNEDTLIIMHFCIY